MFAYRVPYQGNYHIIIFYRDHLMGFYDLQDHWHHWNQLDPHLLYLLETMIHQLGCIPLQPSPLRPPWNQPVHHYHHRHDANLRWETHWNQPTTFWLADGVPRRACPQYDQCHCPICTRLQQHHHWIPLQTLHETTLEQEFFNRSQGDDTENPV